jgi:hypothetical protein
VVIFYSLNDINKMPTGKPTEEALRRANARREAAEFDRAARRSVESANREQMFPSVPDEAIKNTQELELIRDARRAAGDAAAQYARQRQENGTLTNNKYLGGRRSRKRRHSKRRSSRFNRKSRRR